MISVPSGFPWRPNKAHGILLANIIVYCMSLIKLCVCVCVVKFKFLVNLFHTHIIAVIIFKCTGICVFIMCIRFIV